MTKYPLIKELGLKVIVKIEQTHYMAGSSTSGGLYVFADELERLLREGTRVYGWNDDHCDWGHIQDPLPDMKHTHTGLLIGIKPIAKPETAEDLLRELVDNLSDFDRQSTGFIADKALEIKERAKRLLDAKKQGE